MMKCGNCGCHPTICFILHHPKHGKSCYIMLYQCINVLIKVHHNSVSQMTMSVTYIASTRQVSMFAVLQTEAPAFIKSESNFCCSLNHLLQHLEPNPLNELSLPTSNSPASSRFHQFLFNIYSDSDATVACLVPRRKTQQNKTAVDCCSARPKNLHL